MKNLLNHWVILTRHIKKQNKYFIIEMMLSLLLIVMLIVFINISKII
jgi:hypothetical protein